MSDQRTITTVSTVAGGFPPTLNQIEGHTSIMAQIEQALFLPEVKTSVVVRHPRFGVGKVVARYGEDQNSKVIIKFQEEGEKKLLLRLAKLTVDAPVEPEVVEGEEV
ncbi:hypothetical protein GC173_12625 [bacterium]|nr:hypothetical protein [bacterium]